MRWWLGSLIGLASCGSAPPIREQSAPPATLVTIVEFARGGRRVVTLPKIWRRDSDWRDRLSPLAYSVTRSKATELAYTGKYDKHYAGGVYRCVGCNNAIFSSAAKYDSRTGWPSFWEPIAPENVYTVVADREEVLCRRCDAHLGHLFPDGPEPRRMRYCINSAALVFEPVSAR